MPSCIHSAPSASCAIRGQAGELGAGARAAGRAVVGLAGTQHEVAAVGAALCRLAEQLDVIDVGMPLGIRRLAHAPGEVGERFEIAHVDLETVLAHQEEPVAAPGDVARHLADARHLEHHVARAAVARHVAEFDRAIGAQRRVHRPHRRVDADLAGRELPAYASEAMRPMVPWPHMPSTPTLLKKITPKRQSGRCGAHSSAPTMASDPRGSLTMAERQASNCARNRRRTFLERPGTQRRAALEHQACGLAGGMRIDDADLVHCKPFTNSAVRIR